MPYNRHQVLRRLKHLKNKLEINPTFFDHYKEFIDGLFERNDVYGQKYAKPLADSKYWYFYTAEFTARISFTKNIMSCVWLQHGIQDACVNNELMSRTNYWSIDEIRTANIQSMFYQVCVPEEHQDFLRLL